MTGLPPEGVHLVLIQAEADAVLERGLWRIGHADHYDTARSGVALTTVVEGIEVSGEVYSLIEDGLRYRQITAKEAA